MARTYRLDHFTKGTGASVVPVDETAEEAPAEEREFKPRRRARPADRPPARKPSRPQRRGEKRSTPLPPGHVRKKATGEMGRVKSVDSRAGTATVQWLREGRTSVVPLATVSRR
jgi:hypothetical protein